MAIFDIENLNININTIPVEVLKLAENYFAGTSRDATFGSSYNYIIVLYQWYFIDKLEKSEILRTQRRSSLFRRKSFSRKPYKRKSKQKIFREDLALVIDTYFPEEYYEVIIFL